METALRIIVFQVGTEYFGMEIKRVEGIVENTPMTETTDVYPSDIVGMLNLQSVVVPVWNLYEKLQIKPLAVHGDSCFIILRFNEKWIALPVDGVERYYDVPLQCLRPVPAFALRPETGGSQWIADLDGRLIPILDVERLIGM